MIYSMGRTKGLTRSGNQSGGWREFNLNAASAKSPSGRESSGVSSKIGACKFLQYLFLILTSCTFVYQSSEIKLQQPSGGFRGRNRLETPYQV